MRKSLQRRGSAFFPPQASQNGYKYYFGEELFVRKGVLAGWRRFEREFPENRSWQDMRGHLQAFADLEEAIQAWFHQNQGRNSVEVFR